MTERLDRIEGILEQIGSRLDQVASSQEQLTTRFDSLVSETQRLFNRIGDQQDRNSAAIESLADAVARLTQNSEADRALWRESQAEIRRIWEYLLQQGGNGRG